MCVFGICFISAHTLTQTHTNECVIACVCVCCLLLAGWFPTTAPVGHLSSQSYQWGSCNLAANLIIQIAEYLMPLKHSVYEETGEKEAVLFIYSL